MSLVFMACLSFNASVHTCPSFSFRVMVKVMAAAHMVDRVTKVMDSQVFYKSGLVTRLYYDVVFFLYFLSTLLCSALQTVTVSHHKATLATDSSSRAMKVTGSRAPMLRRGKAV